MEHYLPKIKKTPYIEKFSLDVSPENVFLRFKDRINTSFLNSSLKSDSGRYSFIGLYPFLILKTRGRDVLLGSGDHFIHLESDPLVTLDSILGTYKIDNFSPFPFSSGGIGYLAYDLKNMLEILPNKTRDDLELPEIYFVFYRALLIFDGDDPGNIYISVLDMEPWGDKTSRDILSDIKKALSSFPTREPLMPGTDITISSNFTRASYIKAVQKAIDYIKAGDIYQVCLSQRFETRWTQDPYALYLKLNSINPSPFAAYLNFEGAKILSSSPEMFLRVSGRFIETRPMKGTRRRGITADEDEALKESLNSSRKDTAELAMIVDLERNDLGRISVPGSVKVKEHRRVETYPTVFQTISVIQSEMVPDTGIPDILRSTFPGGSISGCPKIRAMEIIDELEPTVRSVYTGSIGYISFHGTMDLNIAIRTMIMKNNRVYFQSGGGITALSDPEDEYEETLHKAKALIKSLSR